MKVVITGGTGMLGRRLALRLLANSELIGHSGDKERIDRLILVDAYEPVEPTPADPRVEIIKADICDPKVLDKIIDDNVDSIFHFAAVVSGGAEEDFNLGYNVNLDGTRNLFESCKKVNATPRVIFTSSLAVYGGFRDIVDGRSLRLPTIVVRPGKPNRAASGFASSILREPLQGSKAICPVSPETRMLILSPRRAVQAFIDVHNAESDHLGFRRGVMMNGISPSIGEMVFALKDIAGSKIADRIIWKPDSEIQRMVDSWPWFANGIIGRELGFEPDESIEEVVQSFIEDELDGNFLV